MSFSKKKFTFHSIASCSLKVIYLLHVTSLDGTVRTAKLESAWKSATGIPHQRLSRHGLRSCTEYVLADL